VQERSDYQIGILAVRCLCHEASNFQQVINVRLLS
jgi:hypothetical protein